MNQFARECLKYTFSVYNWISWRILSRNRKKIEASKIHKIAIINLGFIGDLLATTPLIEFLNKNGMRVDCVALKSMKEVLEGNKSIKKIILVSEGREISGKLKGYDCVIIIHPNDENMAKILEDSKVKNIVAVTPYKGNAGYTNNFSYLLKPRFGEGEHKVMQNMRFAGALGFRYSEPNPVSNPMRLYLDKLMMNRTVKKFKLKEKFAVISPGSRSQKSLGVVFPSNEKFGKIAEFLYMRGITPVIIGTRGDYEVCEEIRRSSKKRAINLAGKTSIREMAALIKASKMVVAVDSGSVHIASALNKKTVEIIRKSQRRIWYPWMKRENYRLLASPSEDLDRISEEEIKKSVEDLLG